MSPLFSRVCYYYLLVYLFSDHWIFLVKSISACTVKSLMFLLRENLRGHSLGDAHLHPDAKSFSRLFLSFSFPDHCRLCHHLTQWHLPISIADWALYYCQHALGACYHGLIQSHSIFQRDNCQVTVWGFFQKNCQLFCFLPANYCSFG